MKNRHHKPLNSHVVKLIAKSSGLVDEPNPALKMREAFSQMGATVEELAEAMRIATGAFSKFKIYAPGKL